MPYTTTTFVPGISIYVFFNVNTVMIPGRMFVLMPLVVS